MNVFGEEAPQRRRLGTLLRDLRQQANLSGTVLAGMLNIGQSSVSRIELGQAAPDADQLTRWIEATAASPEQAAQVRELAADAEGELTAWRHHIRRLGLVTMQEQVAEMEIRAGTIRGYQPVILPGLLQTPEIVRHVWTSRNPGRPDLEAAIARVLARQAILWDNAKTFQYVLGEAALRRRRVASELLTQQIARLAMLNERPNITLGIIPTDSDYLGWDTHGFVLFDDLDSQGHGLVHLELRHASGNVTELDDVEDYRRVFAQLLADSATGDKAQALLDRVVEDLRRQR